MPRAAITIALAAVAFLFCPSVTAQTVWTGFTFSFVKANDADVTLPENQDRITDNVWLTRAVISGIYNIHNEEEYNSASPAGTEWATALNNTGATISAANWASLTFDNWITAYGGPSGMNLPTRLLTHNSVVHLIASDIYLDLQFTSWTSGAGGGGFAYDRAVAPTTPQPTGDYNGNGAVDAADYVVWRSTLNQAAAPPGSGADGDRSGSIRKGDRIYWERRFGNPVSGTGLGAGPVPEPGTFVLIFFITAIILPRPQRRPQ